MFRLFKYLKKYKFEAIFGPIFKLTEAIFELIVPIVSAKIIDVGVNGNGGVPYIIKMGIVMVLLGFFGLGFSLCCQYLASKASQGVGTDLRNDLFKKIQSFSHKEIDFFGPSTLTTRMVSDINQIQTGVAMLIRLAIRVPCLIVGATIMAMSIDLGLSVIFLIVGPLVSFVLYLIMIRSVPLYKVVQKKLDAVSLIARENLDGIRVIRAFSRQENENTRFESASDDLTKTALKVGRISALLNPATFLIMNSAVIAVIFFGGMKVNSGTLTQGEIIAFINYISQILLALVALANLVIILTKAAACASRVADVLEVESSIKDGGKDLPKDSENVPVVEFKNVSFAYNENTGEKVLDDISFTLSKGETLGVIGGTGSGKTTLISLIPRFYDATEGEVLINGENVKNLNLKPLRAFVSVVQQGASIIKGTVKENIVMGRKDISDEDVEKAAQTAQAHEFISKLSEGYETVIERSGSNLSGGQKQRLAIARAVAGNPSVLILDDSASALDFATDAALRRAINKTSENRAVIIVSQRVNSVRYADKIAVLDDGKLAGLDSHEKLLNTCEVYREICLSQLSSEEVLK